VQLLDDIELFSENVTLKITHEPHLVTTLTGISDRGSAALAVTKNNGIANIRQHTSMRDRCEGTFSLRLISDFLDYLLVLQTASIFNQNIRQVAHHAEIVTSRTCDNTLLCCRPYMKSVSIILF
jgi:hypothetical protein